MKYILVTGGVMSGIGKGIVTSSIGALLKACKLRVTAIKIDPYINIDAGTFSPYEHGEVYVLNDGCEVDLDLGNYERFLDVELKANNNITTGKIYQQVIDRERRGEYLGKTVQIVPHITDAIQEWIENAAKVPADGCEEPQICLIELGGTIGDIEGMPFIEALRQLQRRVKRENFLCCHVSFVPCTGPSKEHKTKPTQASVRKLRSFGLHPEILFCRSEVAITNSNRDKIANFCDVETDCVFSLPDLTSTYAVPLELQRQGIISAISNGLKINACSCDRLARWAELSEIATNASREVHIALVGKYTGLADCYTSVVKSLEHACYQMKAKPKIQYVDSSELEDGQAGAWNKLRACVGLLVPGGFGMRGTEGKIAAIQWARGNKVPFLGICLGFQMAVVEYSRNVCGISNAHSAEFVAERDDLVPVTIEMLDFKDTNMGGTMRLGIRQTKFVAQTSILKKLYGNADVILERHRHRYEINPDQVPALEKAGLQFVGRSEDGTRMEILELPLDIHPYFVAVQYHPEYLSRPFKPSPPYIGLIKAAMQCCDRDDKI